MILLFPLAVQSGKRAGLGVNLHYIRRIAHIHSEEAVSLLGVKVPHSSTTHVSGRHPRISPGSRIRKKDRTRIWAGQGIFAGFRAAFQSTTSLLISPPERRILVWGSR